MSTRCQIEFRRGDVRRTVYRHWDGYPSAVIPDLLAFLAWSTRNGDIEYESANFLCWSKQGLADRSVQLGFGICANDELHGDVEYYYVVEHMAGGTVVRAYTVEHEEVPKIGRLVQEVAVPQPLSSSFPHAGDMDIPELLRSAKAIRAVGAHEFEAAAALRQEAARLFDLAAITRAEAPRALPRVQMHGVWYFRDDRLREYRRCDNPHERISFEEAA